MDIFLNPAIIIIVVIFSSLHFLCSVNNSSIRCVSGSLQDSSNSNTTRKGLVVVFIDNAVVNMSGVEFEYRDDPVYTTCSPQKVIPA